MLLSPSSCPMVIWDWGEFMQKIWIAVACGLVVSGCAVVRAKQAEEAQTKMIGLNKEQVLACMGVPAQKAVEGSTEVWSYNSGNGQTVGFGTSSASVSGGRG